MDVLCNLNDKYDVSVKQILCGQCGDDQKTAEYLSASCSVTLIEDAGVKVLVDCCSVYEKDKLLHALSEAIVSPSEITHLVITHWHSDHCGNIALFPNSTLVTPENCRVFISPNIYAIVYSGHSARDVVVKVEQHCSIENTKRVAMIAGDLFECADDWLGEEQWKLSSQLPGCQAIARVLCWKEADVIVPGHGAAFLSPGTHLPLQNPLPCFGDRKGSAAATKIFVFTVQCNAFGSKTYSVFLIRSENSIIVVNTGGRGQASTLSNVLEEQGIHPNKVTHVVITSVGAEYCSNLSLFTNATVYMYNDISIVESFYAPFRAPAMSITPDVFVWKNYSVVDQGQLSVVVNSSGSKEQKLIIADDVDEFVLKYMDLDVADVEICLTSQIRKFVK